MNASDSDPLNLDGVDLEIRLEKLRREIKELGGSEVVMGTSPDCDPQLEEAFLEHVLAFETGEGVLPLVALAQEGLSFPPPDELDDPTLSAKLWELIRALAGHRLYLDCTDHLSDRELYVWLWHDAMRTEYVGFGVPPGNWHVDVLGGCSEEDLAIHMRFYADEEERACWAAQFPDFVMPAREKPPYDRDRHLPQAEY